MEALPTICAAGTAGVVLRYAAAFFLVIVAIALVYMLVRAGRALRSVDKLVEDLDHEIMPVIGKAGTTVDEVNAELDKVNDITASVAGMTERVDNVTRAMESALATPAKKAASFTSGVSESVSSFFSRRAGTWHRADGAGDAGPSGSSSGASGPDGPGADSSSSATAAAYDPGPFVAAGSGGAASAASAKDPTAAPDASTATAPGTTDSPLPEETAEAAP